MEAENVEFHAQKLEKTAELVEVDTSPEGRQDASTSTAALGGLNEASTSAASSMPKLGDVAANPPLADAEPPFACHICKDVVSLRTCLV